MPGPWEQYQAEPQKTEATKAPWEQYQTQKPEDQYTADEYQAPKPTPTRAEQVSKELGMGAGARSERAAEVGKGVGEAALTMATGLGAQVAGGFRGLYGLATGESAEQAAEAVRATEERYTYQPRTETGKLATRVLGAPMEMATALSGRALGGIGSLLAGEQGRVAGESIGEALPALAATLLPVKGAFKAGAKAAEVPVAGETYTPMRELTPEQQARAQRQTEVGMKPTLGTITREPEQFRFEEQLAQMSDTEAGKAMMQRQQENEAAIAKAVKQVDADISKQKGVKPVLQEKSDVGSSLRDALQKREESAWKSVQDAYTRAKQSGETNMVVDTKPLDDWLNKNRAEAHTVPALKSVMDKIEAIKKDFNGNLTLGDMEGLYQTAGRLAEPGKPSGFYMSKVKELINQVTAGKGGDLYREARRARLNYGREFEQQKSIADLIGQKRGYPLDPKVASENIFDRTVMSKSTSVQDLQNVVRTLMSGDLKQFPEGPQAVRELQSQTIRNMFDEANIGTAEKPLLSAHKFKQQMKKIGKDKLNFLLGKDSVKRLTDAVRSMEEMQKSERPLRGSPTYLNKKMEENKNLIADMAAQHLLSELPAVIRYPAKGALWLKQRAQKRKTIAKAGEEAMAPMRAAPEEVSARAAEEKRTRRGYRMEEAARGVGGAAAAAAPTAAQPPQPMEAGL